MALGGTHLSRRRLHGVGLFAGYRMDNLGSRRRAPMNLDQALNLGVLIALIAAIIVIVTGEVIQRWRRR